ncbi:hypothetical protein SAMN04487911_1069 [Arenibacter nanhaiticus]|uniref:Tellurite resistance protein TerB n=1 Tax=Arenibacter nanhaiticus TaxID=558155 RepID=A0A1M6E3J6_9FLAO|nr:hypothetical protein [Arenibacter nanhaiticus]SHI80066.1 hypothetical protein SAMN04487911_1069 [Arenibacter nanhaiticus]
MEQSNKISDELYQNLGKLFYAVAMADNKVRSSEVEKLHAAVRENWVSLEDFKDQFGTDTAYQIEIVFDWLQNEEHEGSIYFKEFSDFYREHKSKFTIPIKKLIWDTSNKIAAAFANKNKAEVIILTKLKILLDE